MKISLQNVSKQYKGKYALKDFTTLFSLTNLWKINNEFHSYSYLADGNGSRSWNSVYWQLYENYKGKITTEKINHLLSTYQPLADATADMTASTATDNPDMMTGNVYSDLNIQLCLVPLDATIDITTWTE